MYVRLTPPHERPRSQQQMMAAARLLLATVFGVRAQVLVPSGIGGAQAPLQVEIRGPETAELQRLSQQGLRALAGAPGLADLKSSIGDPRPEWRIDLDRDAANQVGVDLGQISATLRPLIAGQTATRWEDPTGEERDVVVQVAPEQRQSVEDIASVPVPTATRGPGGTSTIPLRSVARISAS